MERKQSINCPKCGFDFFKLKSTVSLVPCPKCGGCFADVSEDYIRIITHEEGDLQNEIDINLRDMDD